MVQGRGAGLQLVHYDLRPISELNEEFFETMREARVLITLWRNRYNTSC